METTLATQLTAVSVGLLVLRLVVGLVMAAHGSQKLFGWFGGHGLAGTGGFFEMIGFKPGRFFALLAGTTEVVSGLLIAAGFLGGILVNLGSGGASSSQRILLAVGSGVCMGISITLISSALMARDVSMPLIVFSNVAWHSFIAAMFSAAGAVAMEFKV